MNGYHEFLENDFPSDLNVPWIAAKSRFRVVEGIAAGSQIVLHARSGLRHTVNPV
jgi:hypothetical protein